METFLLALMWALLLGIFFRNWWIHRNAQRFFLALDLILAYDRMRIDRGEVQIRAELASKPGDPFLLWHPGRQLLHWSWDFAELTGDPERYRKVMEMAAKLEVQGESGDGFS